MSPSGHHAAAEAGEIARLYGAGQFQAALQRCSEALGRHPEDPLLWNLVAAAAHALGFLDDAERFWRIAIAKHPGYVEAQYNLGCLLQQCKREAEAEAAFGAVLALDPEHVMALNNLGASLVGSGRAAQGLPLLRRSVTLDPGNVSALNNLGLVEQRFGHYDAALAAFDHAIAQQPAFAEAWCSRGLLFMERGEADRAERDLVEAIRLQPDETNAYFNLTLLRNLRADEPLLRQLEALYARRASLPADKAESLDFAMGKALEGLGRYDEAFAAYAEGNRLHHAAHPYDEAGAQAQADEIVTRCSPELFAHCAAAARALPPPAQDRVPVLIVGMARSGTSLIEQILSTHPQVFGAGELATLGEIARSMPLPGPGFDDWPAFAVQLRRLGQVYLDEVWRCAPQSPQSRFIIDKMPGNFRHLGLLQLMLPQARIIHSMRDPMDACFSCYALRFRDAHDYAYDFGTLARYHHRYLRLMRHWQATLPAGRILDLRYEELVAEPEREARRLLDDLGLPWDPACLRFHENRRAVTTASLSQVRQPLYGGSVARWKRFEQHLAPLRLALAASE